jgi:uncharacterized membrane protein YphA (DoxX/SURF4 family)
MADAHSGDRPEPEVRRFKTLTTAMRLGQLFTRQPLLVARQAENRFYGCMARYALPLTRISLGIIYLWFGALKFLPKVTSVDALAENTMVMISFHHLSPTFCLHLLALWECIIGACLIFGRFLRLAIVLLFLHLPGTFLPLILLPHVAWNQFPLSPSLVGHYILKNFILISGGIVICAAARGGKIIAHPLIALRAAELELKVETRELDDLETKVEQETALAEPETQRLLN